MHMVQLLHRRALVLAVAAGLLVPASASAATLQVKSAVVSDDHGSQYTMWTLIVTGEGQDADDITVTRASDGVHVVDATVRVVAIPECAAASEHEVICPAVYGNHLSLDGGDGNDRLRNGGGGLIPGISGGAGDDIIEGDPGPDVINGGPGRDIVHGGGGGAEVTIDAAGGLQGDIVDDEPGGSARLGLEGDIV